MRRWTSYLFCATLGVVGPFANSIVSGVEARNPVPLSDGETRSHEEGTRFRTHGWVMTYPRTISYHPLQNLAFRGDCTAIARVTAPTGKGLKDLNTIRNGVTDESYDSYDGANVAGEDWYGYFWSEKLYFDMVVLYEGSPSDAGGYWKSLTVQYTLDGTRWIEAGNVTISPAYNFSDSPVRTPYSRYELSFTGCLGKGVRIYGRPGGPACFTSIAELEVYGTKPKVVCTRVLPTAYEPGQNMGVSLAVEVDAQSPPANLKLVEVIPAGLTVADSGGGDTSQSGQISWTFGEGKVVNTTLNYSLTVPSAQGGIIVFNGTLSYPGTISQNISGCWRIAPAPVAPSGLEVAFDVDSHLSWSASSREGTAGYRVYRSEEGGDFTDISGLILETDYVDLFVQYGKTYQYKVTSHNVTGAWSDPALSQPSEPGGPSMLRTQFEDYDFEGGSFPGGQSKRGYAARYRSDLRRTDFFYQEEQQTNAYRPEDAMAIPAFNDQEFYLTETSPNDWWRYTFNVPEDGYVKIGAIRAATGGNVTVEFLWDESHKGWFTFNTGGLSKWEIIPVETPAFYSSVGQHTLRILLSLGSADLDYFGIGFQQPEPSRATLFSDDFESYKTTDEIKTLGGWTILNGSKVPEGAWQFWSTTGELLGSQSPDLSGMTGNFVVSDGELAGLAELDEQLTTPQIDCVGYVNVKLQFGSNIEIFEYSLGVNKQFYDVDVSTYDEVNRSWSAWTNVFHHEGVNGDDSTPPLLDISNAASGKKIRLRWRFWKSNYDYWWAVDNMRVTGEKPPATKGKILSVGIAAGKVSLTWEPFGTGSYRVQFTEQLPSGIWSDVQGYTWPITENQWAGDDLTANAFRFYRVKSE